MELDIERTGFSVLPRLPFVLDEITRSILAQILGSLLVRLQAAGVDVLVGNLVKLPGSNPQSLSAFTWSTT